MENFSFSSDFSRLFVDAGGKTQTENEKTAKFTDPTCGKNSNVGKRSSEKYFFLKRYRNISSVVCDSNVGSIDRFYSVLYFLRVSPMFKKIIVSQIESQLSQFDFVIFWFVLPKNENYDKHALWLSESVVHSQSRK